MFRDPLKFRKEGLELEMDEKQGSDLVFWR
jgi:hypothetical protein